MSLPGYVERFEIGKGTAESIETIEGRLAIREERFIRKAAESSRIWRGARLAYLYRINLENY
jgi:hypothetical protein